MSWYTTYIDIEVMSINEKEETEMAKAQTWQQKAAQAREERARQIQIEVQERYRIAKEKERLFNEQLATRTQEEVEAENARWEADRQVQIRTAQLRSREVTPEFPRPIIRDEEE